MPSQQQGFEAIETASIDEIRALQYTRLKDTLQHVYTHSAAYKEKFDTHGVHPDDLHTLEDLHKFPFTTKEDLRQHYPFGMLCVPMEQVVRVHASSGTTGKPTVVAYTREDIHAWATTVARSIYAAGGRKQDMVHVAYGYGLFTGGLGAHYGAELLGCTVIPMSGGQTGRQAQLLRDFAADLIMVTPSYMLNICDELERQGIDPQDLPLRTGIFGAEPWTDSLRKELEKRLHIDAVDIYGLSEIVGPGVSQECIESKDGLTIWEDHYYPEIIDPETAQVLPEGEFGELVFTNLCQQALPMIRYRTRDLTRLLPGTARSMRRMEKTTGRTDDMLIIRGVNVFPTQIEEQILAIAGLSSHYQIELCTEGNLDSLGVQVEANEQPSATEMETLGAQLVERVKSMIGVSIQVQIKRPGELPRSQGKAQRVVDNRKTPL